MNSRSMSLVDILHPPRNNWLRNLSRRKSNLPAGVRVVRFSDYEDDESEVAETVTAVPARQDPSASRARTPEPIAPCR